MCRDRCVEPTADLMPELAATSRHRSPSLPRAGSCIAGRRTADPHDEGDAPTPGACACRAAGSGAAALPGPARGPAAPDALAAALSRATGTPAPADQRRAMTAGRQAPGSTQVGAAPRGGPHAQQVPGPRVGTGMPHAPMMRQPATAACTGRHDACDSVTCPRGTDVRVHRLARKVTCAASDTSNVCGLREPVWYSHDPWARPS